MVGFHNYSEYSPSAITISADFAAIPHCSEIFLDKNRYNADFSKKFCTIVNFVPQYVDFSKKFRTPVNFAPHYKNRLVRVFFRTVLFCLPPKKHTREILTVCGEKIQLHNPIVFHSLIGTHVPLVPKYHYIDILASLCFACVLLVWITSVHNTDVPPARGRFWSHLVSKYMCLVMGRYILPSNIITRLKRPLWKVDYQPEEHLFWHYFVLFLCLFVWIINHQRELQYMQL